MSDQVGNPEDRICHNEAQLLCICATRKIQRHYGEGIKAETDLDPRDLKP